MTVYGALGGAGSGARDEEAERKSPRKKELWHPNSYAAKWAQREREQTEKKRRKRLAYVKSLTTISGAVQESHAQSCPYQPVENHMSVVGATYSFIGGDGNPFEPTTKCLVLAAKEGWVQYRFQGGLAIKWALKIESFNRMYKKEEI